MIKARGHGPDGQVLFLGLSHENLKRLKGGRPIKFDARPYGYDGHIFIFSGADEATMGRMLVGEDNAAGADIKEDPNPT